MKRIIIPLILFLLICGCSQPVSTVATIVPTPVAVTQTFIETPNVTVGPVPTKDENVSVIVTNGTFDPKAG